MSEGTLDQKPIEAETRDRESLDADTNSGQLKESEQVPDGEAELSEAVAEESSDGVLSLEEKLSEAEQKAAEYLDGWQRARADFANARKRLERQRAESYQSAAVDHAGKLLPILDDLDRAMDNVPESIEEDSWFEGIVLVRRKMQAILEELMVQPIEAVGKPFDPNFHEALSLVEADDVDSGIVIEELQTGYSIGERVIRPSLVYVSA